MKKSAIFKMFQAKGMQKPVAKSPTSGPSGEVPAKGKTASKGNNSDSRKPSISRHDQDIPVQAESAQAPLKDSNKTAKTGRCTTAKPGQRIRVYWPDDGEWYRGTVKHHEDCTTTVLYDDGDTEKIDLSQERFELLPTDVPASKKRITHKKQTVKPDVEPGLEDSDVEMSDASGSVFATSEDTDGLEDEASDADMSGDDSEEEVRVPRKRPAEQATEPVKKQVKRSRPSENVDCSNAHGKVVQSLAVLAAASAPEAFKTPQSVAAVSAAGRTPCSGQLRSRLSFATPGTAQTEGEDAMAMGEPAQRFAQRYKDEKFKFMSPSIIRDSQRRRPDAEDYDPATCYIPPDWFKKYKVSDGQRQWWDFKAKNWDSVLLFKMGKFYELFEMDAFVGVDVLGLQFMKGDQPHAGFPEAAYYGMAEQLARKGHRVVVIEQTETPEQLKKANDEAKKGEKRKVVQRTAVCVISQGTLQDPSMVQEDPHAMYVATAVEFPTSDGGAVVGFCAADVAASKLIVGQFHDTRLRSRLLKHFTELNVCEVLVPKGQDILLPESKSMLKGLLPDARFSLQPATSWASESLEADISNGVLFAGAEPPEVLRDAIAAPEAQKALLCAFAGMRDFLKRSMLEDAMLRVGVVERLPGQGNSSVGTAGAADAAAASPTGKAPAAVVSPPGSTMMLDASALSNLEILECERNPSGSVLAQLDHCVTPGGKRALRAWLSAPLQCTADICRRQDAVAELLDGAAGGMEAARDSLRAAGDIERAVVRLVAAAAGALGRDAPGVVLYEDSSKRKVRAVTALLRSLEAVQQAVEHMAAAGVTAEALTELVTWDRRMPDFRKDLEELMSATDWSQAEEDGRVTPKAGVDEAYDAAVLLQKDAEQALQSFLEDFREEIGVGRSDKSVCYIALNKDSHVLEVPEALAKQLPATYTACAGKKGFRRYMSEELQELAAVYAEKGKDVEVAQLNILARITRSAFGQKRNMWWKVSQACSELDALMSLAQAALAGYSSGPMCRPTVTVEHPEGGSDRAFFRVKALRNATQIRLSGAGAFVPNDIDLGTTEAPFMLLTGPNTGGKSTLMRQVCLAMLLAQVGAWLPAEEAVMSPADAIFVRMGAKDHIMMGQSTFMVELSETASMLATATKWSLVALDELGRGTATMDGQAIATAVLHEVVQRIRCRGVFATHYHQMADLWAEHGGVAVNHMACDVEDDPHSVVPKVLFRYLLSPGPCPKSYGPTVARAAGVPAGVAERAVEISDSLEHGTSGDAVVGAFQTIWSFLQRQKQPTAELQRLKEVAARCCSSERVIGGRGMSHA
eukprot:jgi/Ulvmu1/7852/UM004_0083.1